MNLRRGRGLQLVMSAKENKRAINMKHNNLRQERVQSNLQQRNNIQISHISNEVYFAKFAMFMG